MEPFPVQAIYVRGSIGDGNGLIRFTIGGVGVLHETGYSRDDRQPKSHKHNLIWHEKVTAGGITANRRFANRVCA